MQAGGFLPDQGHVSTVRIVDRYKPGLVDLRLQIAPPGDQVGLCTGCPPPSSQVCLLMLRGFSGGPYVSVPFPYPFSCVSQRGGHVRPLRRRMGRLASGPRFCCPDASTAQTHTFLLHRSVARPAYPRR